MSLVSNTFLLFTLAAVLLYYLVPARVKWLVLLFFSCLYYLSGNARYFLFLLYSICVTWLSALWISGLQEKDAPAKVQKWVLAAGLICNLGMLGAVKYTSFIADNICRLFSLPPSGLQILLPLGISFYTFQSSGYLLDVYWKKTEAWKNPFQYALFVSFFPSILSGPINKASLVIPQLKQLRPYFDYSKAVEGLKMLLWGMFMKVVVADRVALYVDTVLPSYENYTGLSCFVASTLYTIQIYADFAGYSLMAIGVGKVLGFELTENFHRPYFAVSVTDFWHRWHISLSTWLKDYIYIPMGGSRCSKLRNYWNIFVTFLVSGIWHGANWTFIVWGCIHGICQIVEKMLGQQKCNYGWLGKSVKIVITFLLVNFAWIFFRMPTLADACGVIGRIFDPSLPMTVYIDLIPNLPFTILGVGLLAMKDIRDEFMSGRFLLMNNKSKFVRWLTYIVLLVLIMITGVFGADQFIYANF